MDSIYQAVAEVINTNELAALCIVVRSQGSTPRRATSKMLVYANGTALGTVGGGEMESRVIAEARQAIPPEPLVQGHRFVAVPWRALHFERATSCGNASPTQSY